MPPRHGKSELASRLFPAYYLFLNPDQEVGLGSYSAELAHGLAGSARDYYEKCGGLLNKSTHAKSDWKTTQGGGMWANGVGGAMTGRGTGLGIIDDPFKGAEDSNSATMRERVLDWYRSVFYTRQSPDVRYIIIGTRWHDEDLIGSILSEEAATFAEEPELCENWHIVDFAAIKADEALPDFPPNCTLEPDWRENGQALCPERYDLLKLRKFQNVLGEYYFSALYQQRPVKPGGSIIKREWFKYTLHISLVPKLVRIVGGVDLAFTAKNSADFTVLFPLGMDNTGRYYLFRPYRVQQESTAVLQGIASRSREAGCTFIGVEAVAAQTAYIQQLRERQDMAGKVILAIKRHGDKEVLARGWAPIAEQGLITLVSDGSGWEETFLKEAEKFPRSKNDDQVDAVGIAFETIRQQTTFGAATGSSDRTTTAQSGFRH